MSVVGEFLNRARNVFNWSWRLRWGIIIHMDGDGDVDGDGGGDDD
jgi:hypothetical protein